MAIPPDKVYVKMHVRGDTAKDAAALVGVLERINKHYMDEDHAEALEANT